MKTKWKTLTGKLIPDIREWVRDATREGQHLHIGCDSLQTQKWTQFVTVVVILNPPKGGRVAYCREVVPRITSLRERLTKEAWHSVNTALELTDIVKGDLTVHLDVNAQERHMSSAYLQELTGLIVGQGFKALWKPDSWAASHVSDHIVRHFGANPRLAAKKTDVA